MVRFSFIIAILAIISEFERTLGPYSHDTQSRRLCPAAGDVSLHEASTGFTESLQEKKRLTKRCSGRRINPLPLNSIVQ